MPRLIKRYSNRKLYDTSESRYVTLEEIARWVKAGEEVRVLENESGEDLTAVTFAQIILEEERKSGGFLSIALMRDLIRSGGEALQNIAGAVESGIEAIRSVPERAVGRVQELTRVSERLGELQKGIDDVVRRSVEAVTSHPTFKQEVQRIEQIVGALEARIGQLRNGTEHPSDEDESANSSDAPSSGDPLTR
jgi:polyhydroxyalkanoate synthesis repressor PhaR